MFEDYLTHVPFAYLSLRRGDYDVANALFPIRRRWPPRAGRARPAGPRSSPTWAFPTAAAWWTAAGAWRITQDAIAGAPGGGGALQGRRRTRFARWLGVQARVRSTRRSTSRRFTPGRPARARADDHLRRRRSASRASASRCCIEAFARVRRERPDCPPAARPPPRPRRRGARRRRRRRECDLVDIDDRVALARRLPPQRGSRALPSLRRGVRARARRGAWRCGTPVVCARARRDAGDRRLRGGRADLRRGDEPPAVAHALLEALELAEDPATPAACRARAEHFSRARCVDQYQSLYRDIGAAQ